MPTSLGYANIAPNAAAAFGKLVPEVFSKEIELKTRELGFTRFKDFVIVKEDLTKNPGDKLYVPKVAELRRAQSLDQTKVLAGSGQGIQTGYVTLEPTEVGDEIQITQYANLVSPNDLVDLARELLARQALKTENFLIRDIMFGSLANRYFAGGVANQAAVTADLDADDIDYVVENLENAEALKWPGEAFIGFIHPYAKTDIINDLIGTAAYQAGLGGQLYAGEIGMYNRTRFIESAYVPQQAYSVAGITGATGGVTVASASHYELGETLCKAEVLTFTYTASGDSWAVAGSKSGARKVALFTANQDPNDPTKVPVVAKATTWTDTNMGTYDAALAVEDEDGNTIGYDVIIGAAAISGASSDGTCTLTLVVNTETAIFGQRYVCFGVIRNVTLLGVESFDYGRTLGVGWNAFWDTEFLHKTYGYVIEAKR